MSFYCDHRQKKRRHEGHSKQLAANNDVLFMYFVYDYGKNYWTYEYEAAELERTRFLLYLED